MLQIENGDIICHHVKYKKKILYQKPFGMDQKS